MTATRLRFTARSIEAIKPPPCGQKDYWDANLPGFGVRVSAAGRKSWVVMYRSGGIKRRLTLGTYPAISLAAAREQAADALRAVAHGGDPATSKKSAREADTFAELSEEYLEGHAKPKKRTWKKDELVIRKDLAPRFGRLKATDVKRRDVIKLLDEIRERGAPIQANRTLEILRKMYNWAISREIVEHNPCHGIERPSPEHRRERVLTDSEIKAVWQSLGYETPRMAGMFKLRLLTAQRGGEVSRLRWQDIDIDGGWWTIPPEFSKNGLAHRVPLSTSALEIIEGMREASGDGQWVFPSRTRTGPCTVIWKSVDRIRMHSGVDFVPHDLRRTAASRMTGDLRINRLVVSKILNHAEPGVTATYDRHSYDKEKRLALDAWAARLEEIIENRPTSSNVVPLATGSDKG
jgi:integrase